MKETQIITNQQIINEILASRNDLKATIETSEARLLLKIEELNNRINILENENLKLKNKCEILDQKNRKNSILIFGLKTENQNIKPEFICQQIKTLLGIDLINSDINNVYSLGSASSSPIKVEFVSYLNKIQVFKNCNKLKGKKITIVQDLTPEQRQENKKLRKHLNQFRQNKQNKCHIRENKLVINGRSYTSQELDSHEYYEQPLNNSVPETPTPHPETNEEQDKDIAESTPVVHGIQSPTTGAVKKQLKSIPAIKDKLRNRGAK